MHFEQLFSVTSEHDKKGEEGCGGGGFELSYLLNSWRSVTHSTLSSFPDVQCTAALLGV